MEKIKGFSIELSLDSLKVDSGLTDLKASMRQMNSEMRRNMSSFDYGERSLKKYGVQLDGLNKKYELQKLAVEDARKHYEKMIATHEEGSKEVQNAAAAYNHEVATLNNLERHIQKVTKEMQAFKREQEIQSTALWKAGDALQGFGTGLGNVSEKMRDVGRGLTDKITKPALIAGSAVAGLVGALGFKRLVGMDNAQAKLKGLGVEGKQLEVVMESVKGAVTGTTHTMADGADVAAGALAAGVKEGAELERYIKLVGDAATGANMPMSEMAQIFNRVQGTGKLTRNELDMIEYRLPGFSQAMMKHVGADSLDAFHDMVRAGKVGTDEFLDVMDDFAGGMSEAYASTWSGLKDNILANIGIIGEGLLEGLFEDGKKGLAKFLEVLRESEGLKEWATETGEKLRELAGIIANMAKTGIDWFNGLSDNGKKTILGIGGFLVALGPLLVGLGTVGGIIAKVSFGLGEFFKFLAPLFVPLKKIGTAAGATGKSVGLLSRVFTFLTGPVGIAIGIITTLTTAFVVAYKKSETFREFIQKLGEKIKEIFKSIKEWIQPGIDAVVEFFGEIKKRITDFKENEGAQLSKAFENFKEVTSIVFEFISGKIIKEFDKVKKMIEFVMPFIESVIKNVWGGIKTIITGALDIILGAVKVFSGIFTGDFSKMWEGVKSIFKGAINIVWGLIRVSFVGQIISSIINFVKNFKQNISDLWKQVKETFNNRIIEIRKMISNSFVGRMLTSVRNLKTNFVKIAKDMWSGVKEQFNNIVEGAKALPGRIGKGIRNARDKATDGMKSVGNSIIRWAGKPFNKVVDGVNWITGKLGVDKKIAKWDYPQYAKGTDRKGHPGGWAMVGEEGRELIQLPSGKSIISPDSHTMMNLPKGTHVIPNKPTEKILKSDLPHYAKGTGLWEGIKDVWGYISNPSKLVDSVMDKISIASNLAAIPKAIVSGGFNYLKTKPYEYIKKLFSESGGGGKPAFGWPMTSPFGYRIHPISGQRKLHGGVDFGAPMGSPVPSTTGGTVSFASGGWNGGFGNLVKVRQGMWEMFYAHLSKILVKAGQSVKKGDILGLVGSTGASTGPHLHYETRKNGVRVNPMALKGFKTGGVIKSRMMAMLGEDGEEIVIPTAKNRRTDAMKLLALAAKKIGVEGGNYSRPTNLQPNRGTDNETKKMIALLIEQNEYLRKSNELLTTLVGKDLDFYKLNNEVDKGLAKRTKLTGRVAY